MSRPVPLAVRPAARVVLFDAADHMLLFRYHDEAFVNSDRPDLVDYWLTPGGGQEAGETLAQTAQRELAEECGFTGIVLSPCVALRHITLTIHGILTRCEEHFFVGRVSGRMPPVDTSGQFQNELDVLREIRWWRADDMHLSDVPVVPTGLPDLVPRLITGDLPKAPIFLEG